MGLKEMMGVIVLHGIGISNVAFIFSLCQGIIYIGG